MARLPTPGADDGTWGVILNDFLSQSLNSDGSLKDSAVADKADDSTVVHNTTDESIGGIKTFTSSPIVPTPTSGTQAANKAYVDSTALSGAPDATTGSKGIIQLAGDLGGTAAAPTVTGLAGKLDSSTVTTKGDLLAATGSSAVTRLGVGSDGRVLTADSTQTTGLRWAPTVAAWAASTAYTAGQVVAAPSGHLVAAATNFTSSSTYDSTNWVIIKAGMGINVRDFGAKGDGSTNDTTAFQAALTAAQSAAVNGRIPPVLVPAGNYKLTSALQMYDYLQMIGTGGAEFYALNVNIFNQTTDIFSWPSGSTKIKGLVLRGIAFFGQSNNYAGGVGNYTTYPFDHTVYGSKQLWYPLIENCVFQYFVSVKLNLLGGVIDGGQMLHMNNTCLYLQGYDYSIAPRSPLYMGQDSSGANTPLMYCENGSNNKIGDIFPTVIYGGRGLHLYNMRGTWVNGSRLDGYNTGSTSAYPISGAALYADTCTGLIIISPRIHGAMGGPAQDGVSPTDQAAITIKDSTHVTIVAPHYRRQPAGSGTIGFVGTCDDIKIAGCIYETPDSESVRNDAVGAVVTNLTWDELGTPGPAGPMPFTAPTVWNSATSYIAPSGTTPGNSVTRLGGFYMAVANNTNIDPATDDGSNWSLLAAPGAGANYLGFFGDGSDGVVAMDGTNTFAAFASKSGSTYTLTRDVLSTTLTINSGVTLNTGNFAIYCTGTLTNGGTISAAGGTATTATGGTGGGTASQSFVRGGTGGTGTTGAGAAGGSGGYGGANGGLGGSSGATAGGATGSTTTATVTRLRNPELALAGGIYNAGTARALGGGGGGGSGAGDGTFAGGGGGGGGGTVCILAHIIVNNGSITANGGNGANGLGGNAGGGAGGGGGIVMLYTLSSITGSGTRTANAGTGGSGAGTGNAGASGTVGNVLAIVLA